MLQQTRVEAVRERYVQFMQRFPDAAAFARANDEQLLHAWRGLGYYRRARYLRDGAREVAKIHGGTVPDTVKALRTLPGVGAYTAGAIASIAFGRASAAVDGNVERVVARHRGFDQPIGTPAARKFVESVVDGWQDRDHPGDFNQALMELGALVCTPTSPTCDACPIAADCVARIDRVVEQLPVKQPKRAPIEVQARVALVLAGGSALGYRIPAGQPNAGQIELPGPGVLQSASAADLAAAARERFAADVRPGPVVARIRHAITHHRIVLQAHAATAENCGQLAWFPATADVVWTTPSRKVFRQVFGDTDERA